MNWEDPTLVSSLISAISSVLTTLIGSISAAVIGKRFMNSEELKKNLKTAQSDIAFLLFVEEELCRNNEKTRGRSTKLRVREVAREAGHTWSGRFTPGRVRAREQLGDDASKLIRLFRQFRAFDSTTPVAPKETTDVAN